MATLILSAAGGALGGAVGGSVLGVSAAALGRVAGAAIGRSIDARLLGPGAGVVETGRVSRLRLTGSGEGDAIARVWGRMRVPGQVIWATEFDERVTVTGGGGGGKGTPRPARPERREISYSVSLALALCEGEITHLGRVWADGTEIAPDSLNLRLYRGTTDQLPDPRIEAVEGAGSVPAYRGTAYVVIEDLEISPFGNRVPQFTFEVCRPAQPHLPGADLDPAHGLRAVALLPGTGEYALATTPAKMRFGPGSIGLANVATAAARPDMAVALDALTGELPGVRATSLVVAWFGDDLRAGECRIRPRVERRAHDATNMPWTAGGIARAQAGEVPRDATGALVYGGTPADQAVIEAILALKAKGLDVMYYPFLLMEQMPGNGLPDPWSDAPDQPVLPWRGRITARVAPGRDGSPDGTTAATDEVAAFFGTARAADFSVAPVAPDGGDPPSYGGAVKTTPVAYSGPAEWRYRRFILHQAALCAAAGGVESFCIGSEMRGLTQIRGPGNSFPAVAQLVDLAAEVRSLLGPEVRISYAADWTEYFGYQTGDGDRFFHLDPLWADANIDFVGIDNYMPLSDWRDGTDHADAIWGAIHDLGYLQSNIEGGEGHDWFYPSPEARAAQRRVPITDGAYAEPWVWRVKDIRNWWGRFHHERTGGVRNPVPTAWLPESKPVRFTEMGCAAVEKGTNQPNRFLDPKSSESGLPHFSDGRRDDLIQMQYLRALTGYWRDPARNPVSRLYDGPMIDIDHAHVWAWDARPFPAFPNDRERWSDGANWARGHWITGRVSAQRMASAVQEMASRAGLAHDALDLDRLHAHVSGYLSDQVETARAALQPLMLAKGVDAVERDGALRFQTRDGRHDHAVSAAMLVEDAERGAPLELSRAAAAELSGRVRLRFVEADADFDVIAEEAVLADEATHAVSTSEMPLALTRAQGRQVVARWLAEARLATDTLALSLPPSRLHMGAGDVIAVTGDRGAQGLYRIDRVELLGAVQRVEAVRTDPAPFTPLQVVADVPRRRAFALPVPVTPLFLDLPLITGDEVPHAPHLTVTADPWPGAAALYASDTGSDWQLDRTLDAPGTVGVTETPLDPAPPGLIDRGAALRVRMLLGTLAGVDDTALLGGANLCAIGDGTPGGWELWQFRDAELVDADTYLLGHRLRGQLGTEGAIATPWPAGSFVVRLDGRPVQTGLPAARRGMARHYRIGPAGRPLDDPAFEERVLAFDGLGLRPYRPVHLRVRAAGDGGLILSWIRRTRTLDGDRWDIPEVPLFEEREQYLLRILDSGSGALRREILLDAPAFHYDAAMRAADGLTGQAVNVHVAQISATFGPGPVATYIHVPLVFAT